MSLERKTFWISLIGIFGIELLSFFAYQFGPVLQTLFLIASLTAFLILCLAHFETALLVVLIELFVGSFGHLFQIEIYGERLPLRIGFFLIFNGIFFIKTFFTKSFSFRKSRYFWPNVLLSLVVIFSILIGFLKGNGSANILNDANSFAFFTYFPAIFTAMSSDVFRRKVLAAGTASIVWLAAQSGFVLFIFAHRLREPMRLLYLWIRDARIGEITFITADFYRFFFQSYVFALIAFFVTVVLLAYAKPIKWYRNIIFFVYTASVGIILLSLSRSFWFGVVAGSVVLIITAIRAGFKPTNTFRWFGILLAGFGFALVTILVLVDVPFPPKGPPILIADLLRGRATSFLDAAATSRWQLLSVLKTEIIKTPILGAGFGKTVTYLSSDPRIVAETGGTYTTFAFEWNYLDLWLKLGLMGLVTYGWLIIRILRQGWYQIKKKTNNIHYGLWLGLIALLAANVFTPYLNHPLGIGALMIIAGFFEDIKEKLGAQNLS